MPGVPISGRSLICTFIQEKTGRAFREGGRWNRPPGFFEPSCRIFNFATVAR